MSRPKTQTERVLAALQRGPITQIDFGGFPTCDGGPPIMRLAARIGDLRDAGYVVDTITTTAGSARVAKYYLKSSPSSAVPPTQASDGPGPPPAGSSSPTSPGHSSPGRVNAGAVRVVTAPPAPAPLPPRNTTPVAAPHSSTGHDAQAAPQLDLFNTPAPSRTSPYQEAA